MNTEFPNLDLLLYWGTERDRVRTRREAGEPRPWSEDLIFQRERFLHVERERDRVSIWIRENWREPYRDNPDVWFLLAVARLGGNDPRILAEITPPLPWDKSRYLAEMAAKTLKVGVRGYRSVIGRGIPTHEHLAHNVFDKLWAARERVRPRGGDTCRAFFNRLSAFDGLGGTGFLAGQIVADVKFTPPLCDAVDFWDFATRGPGSGPGLNVVMGRDFNASWSAETWDAAFARLRPIAGPRIEKILGRRLSASDLQSCLCELSKWHRAKTSGRISRPFTPSGVVPARHPRKAPIAPPAPAVLPPPAPREVKPHARFAALARRFIVSSAVDQAGGLRLVFDIEAADLLAAASKVHCIVIGELDSDRIDQYGPEQISAALEHLARADCLVGHNIAGYDLPLLERLHGWRPKSDCTVVDTLIASRLILSDIGSLDDQAAAMGDPPLGKLRGRHSLEAWGCRLGVAKSGTEIEVFSTWTPELQARCVSDVALTKALWRFLRPDGYSRQAVELEHRVAAICDRITADGVPFDAEAAERLRAQWTAHRAELEALLRQQFPNTKNFNSRLQIAKLLEVRGWVPEQRTEKTGKPKINDELLEALPALYPEFSGLAEHYTLGRRLGQLSSGARAWCGNIGTDGRIHGGLVHLGTPHSRAKHLAPNLAQVPNPKRGKPLATECRALFSSADWVFVACDQATLQDRAYAHYLAEFDGGAYIRTFLAGVDQHWHSAITLSLVPAGTERDKENAVHSAIREGAKSFRYGFLFGAGNARAGRIIYDTIRAALRAGAGPELRQLFFGDVAQPSQATLMKVGKKARDAFIAGTPGLGRLRMSLETQARRHGWLPGLDGRPVPVRALYTVLNYAVTSAEAIICKRWLVRVHDELRERFRYGWDGDVVIALWIHDELVVCCRPELPEEVGAIMVRHAKEPGEFYGLRVPLDAEYKIGRSWAGEPIEGATAASIIPEPADNAGNGADRDLEPIAAISQAEATTKGTEVLFAAAMTASAGKRPPPQSDAVPPWVELDDDLPSRSGNGHAADGFDSFPDQKSGGKILCPFHDDHTPSLHIYPDEDDPHYHCFVCGAHGPLNELEVDWKTALKSPTGKPADDADDADNARNLEHAHELWNKSKPIAGTLAERYLAETRGIDVGALPPNIDNALRFHPRCPFGDKRHPCLIALFRDIETGERAGIHRIALTPDAQKIERRMFGRWPRPRAIKLWPADDKLYVGEGIETVLAAATRLGMRPAWALASTSYLEKLPAISGIAELGILVDRDARGEAAAEACCQTWKAAGRRVRRLRTKDASLNDFNDLICSKLRAAP